MSWRRSANKRAGWLLSRCLGFFVSAAMVPFCEGYTAYCTARGRQKKRTRSEAAEPLVKKPCRSKAYRAFAYGGESEPEPADYDSAAELS